MPTNKNAQLRYQILDRCFSDFLHKYTIDDLIDKVNEVLMDISGSQVSIRQIREDIKYMKDRVTYNAPIEAYPYEGRKCYYRYSDKNFSIFNNELSTEEVTSLRSTIDILSRFRGIPTNAWLEDVISTITNLAADMEDDVDMILALFRMGNQRIMPILRNDLKQRDIVALLSAIIAQEQRDELAPINWNMVLEEMWSQMTDDQKDSMLGKSNLGLN